MSKQDKTATGENAAPEQTDRELSDREMEEVAGGVSNRIDTMSSVLPRRRETTDRYLGGITEG